MEKKVKKPITKVLPKVIKKKEIKPLKEILLEAVNKVLTDNKVILSKKIEKLVKKSVKRIVKRTEKQNNKTIKNK